MLTDAQVYCMTSMIYLFRSPLTAKAIYRKTAEAKLCKHLIQKLIRCDFDILILLIILTSLYKDYAFRWFPCPDPFLECQRFVNFAVRVRSWVVPPGCSLLYITLLVGVVEGKKRIVDGGNRSVLINLENRIVSIFYLCVAIISI